jgi:hypothetical protein
MRGDPLALGGDFDRTRREPDIDLGAGEAMQQALSRCLGLVVTARSR